MTDSKAWFEQGINAERESIIALLQSECVCEPMRGDNGNCSICYITALIKGENDD